MSQRPKLNLLIAAGIILLGSIIYANSLHTPFQYDDEDYIVDNKLIQYNVSLSRLATDGWFKHRVVPIVTFALNYQWSRLNPFGYHVTNLIIHLINALLVWRFVLLLLTLVPKQEERVSSPKEFIALLCALLFLTHPLQTQAVTYISQRFTSLTTLFYLAALILYINARLRHNLLLLIAAAGAGVLSLFSKQIALTLPLNLLLIEWLFLRNKRGESFFKYGLCIAAGLSLIIPALYKFDAMNILGITTPSDSHYGDHLNSWTYFLTQQRVILLYLKLLFLPVGQNILHDVPASHNLFDPITTFLSFNIILALIVTAFKLCKSRPLLAYGMLWYFLCLSVESSFITIKHVMFEHRVYLPSIGFFLVISLLVFQLIKGERVRLVILVTVILALSVLTYQRNKVWRSPISLWEDAVRKSPRLINPRARLGAAYLQAGRAPEALSEFDTALAISPRHPNLLHNRALALSAMGRTEEAAQNYAPILGQNPNNAQAYFDRGNVYAGNGNFDLALHDFTQAVLIAPQFWQAHNNRGLALQELKRYEEAIAQFDLLLKMNPGFTSGYLNRGNTYYRMGQAQAAIADYTRAIEATPDHAKAYFLRSLIYKEQRRFSEALKDALKVESLGAKLPPDYIKELQEGVSSP